MGPVIVGWHTPFAIVILAHQRIVDVDPGAPFGLHTRHVVATPSLLWAAAARAANSSRPYAVPAMPQPPSAASVSSTHVRWACDGSPQISAKIFAHVLHELLLAASREGTRRRDDLHADGTRHRVSRRLDRRWVHPMNECRRVLQMERHREHSRLQLASIAQRQLLADPAVGSRRQEIARRVDINHRHRNPQSSLLATRLSGRGMPRTAFAAFRITSSTSSGLESIGTWLLSGSVVVAPMRFATNRSRSGLNRAVFAGHDVPARLRLPRGAFNLLIEEVGSRHHLGRPDELLFLLGQVSREAADAFRPQPDAPVRDLDVREHVRPGKLILLALGCLVLVGCERRDVDEPRHTVVCSRRRDDRPPYEWPTRMAGLLTRPSVRLTVATSPLRESRLCWLAITSYPSA